MSTTKQAIAALAAFAALALLASQPAAAHDDEDGADGNDRHYVVPFIPGEGESVHAKNYNSVFIMVSNPQSGPAKFSMKAYLDGSTTAVSCDTIPNLAPYEIRRFARHLGELCADHDEAKSYSLRIETVKGVQLTGFYTLSERRGWGYVPMVITRVAVPPPPPTLP